MSSLYTQKCGHFFCISDNTILQFLHHDRMHWSGHTFWLQAHENGKNTIFNIFNKKGKKLSKFQQTNRRCKQSSSLPFQGNCGKGQDPNTPYDGVHTEDKITRQCHSSSLIPLDSLPAPALSLPLHFPYISFSRKWPQTARLPLRIDVKIRTSWKFTTLLGKPLI